jgi:DNA topoisomerase-1
MTTSRPHAHPTEPVHEDPIVSARSAGLRYVSDDKPGLARKRAGKGFRYVDGAGGAVRDAATLARIRGLAIPPAWTHVWICPLPLGHIQATGRDARGRKQYRYHPRWREVRDEAKYDRMMAFGAALPKVRERTTRDLALTGMPREKVLATVVVLLERTLIRVGNEEYARANASFGLTTLRERHVKVEGRHLFFHFRGKSGKEHAIHIADPRLATIVKRCQDLPGQELFHFRDDEGALHPVESAHVNDYLREAAGDDFTAKDFRTWHGTLLAAQTLSTFTIAGPDGADARRTKRLVTEAVKQVAARLGNTPTVCRKSYVHPAIVSRYLRGEALYDDAVANDIAACEARLLAMLKEEAARPSSPRRAA